MSTYWLEVREARDVALFILGALREESLYVSCRGADCSSSQVVALKHVINVSIQVKHLDLAETGCVGCDEVNSVAATIGLWSTQICTTDDV
jgi:hypothetical protein